jgi:hypothetical protein
MKSIVLSIMLSLCLVLGAWVDPSFSKLKAGYQEIIRIAFINGFVAAAGLGTEELNLMKKEPDLLRFHAERASKQYLEKVADLNE